jgi:hypothetical protein
LTVHGRDELKPGTEPLLASLLEVISDAGEALEIVHRAISHGRWHLVTDIGAGAAKRWTARGESST